jgi:D-alanine-D-alanine ligase
MNTEFGKVAVLMGGNSAEREVSLKSGNAVLAALKRQNVDAHAIDTADNIKDLLCDSKFDRAFIILHGRGGEDGTIQGFLESIGMPYTGTQVLGSALAMDKYRTKMLWQAIGLPTPECMPLNNEGDLQKAVDKLGLPLMIKPVLEGSSVGMSKVNHIDELMAAWKNASQYNCLVIAERYITGLEYTAAILDNRVLPFIRLETPRDFYDYNAKYSDDTKTSYICPCGLGDIEQSLHDMMMQAFLSVGAKGLGRVDFMMDADGQPWLLEVNTVPGMTDHSLVPMAAKAAGINFDELVLRILASSLE